ncbi:MAG: hypothetical protein JXR63_12610 [Spirochaetales bacterium]|nr:hypothetical protein [Spirochaetales bacterium]
MKIKSFLIVLACLFFLSCGQKEYNDIYSKSTLSFEDCKNTKFASWLLQKETGIKVDPNKLQVCINSAYVVYNGGPVPGLIRDFPVYYKFPIDEKEYNCYKLRFILDFIYGDWSFSSEYEKISFALMNKHDLQCEIDKDTIIFGMRNSELVAP